jgi:hypothetical protein
MIQAKGLILTSEVNRKQISTQRIDPKVEITLETYDGEIKVQKSLETV